MNNAWSVVSRWPGQGIRTALLPRPCPFLVFRITTAATYGRNVQQCRSPFSSSPLPFARSKKPSPAIIHAKGNPSEKLRPANAPSSSSSASSSSSFLGNSLSRKSKSSDSSTPPQKRRTSPQTPWKEALSASQIGNIFGPDADAAPANELLTVLHERRRSGSLGELGISVPTKLGTSLTEDQAMRGLEWLRDKYPVDEAGAAMAWADQRAEEQRMEYGKTAMKFKVLKDIDAGASYEPQAGEGRYGHSVVQEMAQKWQAKSKEKQRKKEEEAKIQDHQRARRVGDTRIVMAERVVELDVQREEKFRHWENLKEAAEIEPEKIMAERSAFSRLFKPSLFGVSLILLCTLLLDSDGVLSLQNAVTPDTWKLPNAGDISPSMITCAVITALHLALYMAWKVPRLWWSMNRFCLLSAGHPNTFSVLGSMASHQFWTSHLLQNTVLLFLVGMPVHDEIGRLNFLALYIASGVFGSLSSLFWNVLRRNYIAVSHGSSGAVSGLIGAYFTVQPERAIYVPFTSIVIPFDSTFGLVGFLLLELSTMYRTRAKQMFDHAVHLGGFAAGMMYGFLLRPNGPREHPVDEAVIEIPPVERIPTGEDRH